MLTDLFVIVIYFLAIFCIGIYAGRKQNSLTDYALGNRSLPWWAILASILAAEISAATFLGAPGEGYHTRNFTYAQLCIGTILGRIIVGRLFLKPYYDYKVVSIYEYLEKRFGLLTRRTASMVFLISRVLASGTRLYFAGILLVIAYQFLTGVTADADQIVLALYRYLTRTPSRLLALALPDAVGDVRTQNQPGTTDEYPNWRVPLAGPDGRKILLEDLFSDPRAAALAQVMADAVTPGLS